jgi:hypothetical protein
MQHLGIAATHVAGGVAGGAATAALVWLGLTPVRTLLPGSLVAVVLAAVVGAALVADLRPVGPVRRRGRQVPQEWAERSGPYLGFFRYGAVLGAGLVTYVPVALVYVVWAAVGLLLSLSGALVCGTVFGFARAFAVALASLAPRRSAAVLFRGAGAHRVLPLVSAVLSAAVLADGTVQLLGG